MPEYLLGQRQLRAQQHRRPDHAVETGDVLADHVQVGRPPAIEQLLVPAVADRRRVVDQRVEPDIDHAAGVEGDGNAPRLPGPAHRDVLEAALDQPQDLVAPDLRLDEAWMLAVVIEQRLLVLRQPEEPVLLANPVGLGAVDRAQPLDQVLFGLERLAADAVEAFVGALVDVAIVEADLGQLLHRGEMPPAVAGADEVVERDVQPLPDVAEDLLHLVAVGQRILALLDRLAEDVLRVLVVPHQEMGVVAGQPPVAGDDIGGDLLVGRAQVRAAVDEVDGGGQEVAHARGLGARGWGLGLIKNPRRRLRLTASCLATPSGLGRGRP